VNPPRPEALRIVTTAPGKAPRPPLGLRAWDPSAAAAAVLLDARGRPSCTAADVAAQLPAASTMPAGTPLLVLGSAAHDSALWRLFARGAPVTRAARCSALIARGYVDVGAGLDEASGTDLAWGIAP
jgi:hypothetical protein